MIRNNNNQQNGRRRGRGGGQGGGGGMGGAPRPQGQNFGNNRLDIRQRGNATQLLEKYKTLARDAAQQGDRVVSEYYLQYADHYFRVLNEIRERQPEHQRGPRPGYDAEEDGEDVGNGYNPGYAASNESQAQPEGDRDRERDEQGSNQRYDQGQRDNRQSRPYEERGQSARGQQDGRRDDNRRDDNRRDDRGQADRSQPARGQQDSQPRDGTRRDRGDARGANGNGRADYRDSQPGFAEDDRPQDTARYAQSDDEQRYAQPAEDSRDAEPVLAGLPGPARLSPVAADGDVGADEAPKRRRGRPRKVVDTAPPEPADA